MTDEIVSWLEMTAPDQLVPGSPAPQPVTFERLGPRDLDLARDTALAIGDEYGWETRPAWSTERWSEWLARPTVHALLARTGGDVLGMVEAEAQAGGDTEIVIFGLVPAWVGRGYGGHLLTEGTRRVWAIRHPDGTPTRRVWLHTSTKDHPHALHNYERRGFRVVRHERRPA
jgi:GNAT superfamily N-acetyltransferase